LEGEDRAALLRASEFMLHVRNELHFHSQKAHDVLDRSEQLRVAKLLRYEGSEGLLPVEQFMRDYFLNSNAVQNIVARFIEGARPWNKWKQFWAPVFSRGVEGDFRIGPTSISATPNGLAKLDGDLSQILRLTDLANQHNKRIAHPTLEAVRRRA